MVHYFELRFIDIDAGINVCYTNGVIGTGGASRPLLFWREKRFMNKKTRTCETGTALFGFLYISFLIAVLSVAFLSSVHKDHNENNTPINLIEISLPLYAWPLSLVATFLLGLGISKRVNSKKQFSRFNRFRYWTTVIVCGGTIFLNGLYVEEYLLAGVLMYSHVFLGILHSRVE